MRIERVEVYAVDLPYSGGTYRLSAGRSFTAFPSTVVRVVADDGTEGWGESVPFGSTYVAAHSGGVQAALELLGPAVLGLDPRGVDHVARSMDAALVGHEAAKTAIDVACWDLFGHATGLPVHTLLGGSTGDRMALVSSVHLGDPDDMRTRVAEHRAAGYRAHSVKVGTLDEEGGPAIDAERVAACVADRQPGEYFLVDANGGMSVENALRFLRLLPADADIVFEAPCATTHETAALRRRTDVPIVLDELIFDDASVANAIAGDLADGIGMKVSKNGGLTPCRRQRDMAIAGGLTMSVQDTVGSDIAFAAVVHLAQTVPARWLRGVLDVRDMVTVSTGTLPVAVENGGVMAPDLPGLGVTVDRDVLGDPIAVHG